MTNYMLTSHRLTIIKTNYRLNNHRLTIIKTNYRLNNHMFNMNNWYPFQGRFNCRQRLKNTVPNTVPAWSVLALRPETAAVVSARADFVLSMVVDN